MNPEEKDYQIDDVIDFGEDTEDQDDLTPEVTDFDNDPSQDDADNEQPSDSPKGETSDDIISLHSEEPIQNLDQKETSPSQPRVMRYEDFLKNL